VGFPGGLIYINVTITECVLWYNKTLHNVERKLTTYNKEDPL